MAGTLNCACGCDCGCGWGWCGGAGAGATRSVILLCRINGDTMMGGLLSNTIVSAGCLGCLGCRGFLFGPRGLRGFLPTTTSCAPLISSFFLRGRR